MSHSLIGADRGTHCKIVAVALAAAVILTVAGINARMDAPDAASTQAQAPVAKAGTPARSAGLGTTATH